MYQAGLRVPPSWAPAVSSLLSRLSFILPTIFKEGTEAGEEPSHHPEDSLFLPLLVSQSSSHPRRGTWEEKEGPVPLGWAA